MIDFQALQKQFDARIPAFFASRTSQITEMQRCWFEQLRGKSWQELAQAFSGISQYTTWQGPIDAQSTFGEPPASYSVLGVDGSQIYADRHQGLPWSLLTISQVFFTYTPTSGKATFATTPVLLEYQEPSVLDARRSMLELQKGVEVMLAHADPSQQQILVFDGPLSPSFGKDNNELQAELSAQFKALLAQCYQHKVIIAGYTSAPRARDLVRLLELVAGGDGQMFDQLVDSDLVALFLQQGQYSTCFTSTTCLVDLEPPLRLVTIYAHMGSEIVRVELPTYLAQDPRQRALVMALLYDQVNKGYGYPAVLAEAHEHAVVREADRQLFFQLARRKADELGMHTAASRKSIKKRFPLV